MVEVGIGDVEVVVVVGSVPVVGVGEPVVTIVSLKAAVVQL